jgi:hypothetical protein
MSNIDPNANKTAARNSMLERLQSKIKSKIKSKNIKVEAVEENYSFEDDEPVYHSEHGQAAPVEAPKVEASALLNGDHLFAVVAIGEDLIGGTVVTVEAELNKIRPESYEIKIVTSDEKAAKALLKAPKAEAAAPHTDEVGSFYVVTHASPVSELHDICFKTDIMNIILQTKGGLDQSDILGIYKTKEAAVAKARELLKAMNSPHAEQDDSVVEASEAVAGPHDQKLMALLTAIEKHMSNAEGEAASGAIIAEEYNKYLEANEIEDLGMGKLADVADQIQHYAEATKSSSEKILGIV